MNSCGETVCLATYNIWNSDEGFYEEYRTEEKIMLKKDLDC